MNGSNEKRSQPRRLIETSAGKGASTSQSSAARLLSSNQERILRLGVDDSSQGSQIRIQIHLQGALNRNALRSALDRIIARHEVLRTRFGFEGGKLVQRIEPPETEFTLEEHPRGVNGPHGPISLTELPMSLDLTRGPVVRGQLVQIDELEHVLIIAQHAIVADTWSVGVLIRELAILYSAFCAGEADPLPPLPLQFAEFARAEREQMNGERLRWRQEYWGRVFAAIPERLSLPGKGPPAAMRTSATERVSVHLPAELYAQLQALAHRKDMPLFIPLLCGWAVLLGRWAGQDDVVIGTPMPNRSSAELRRLIGPFENLIALRVRFHVDMTVDQLLNSVKTVVRKGQAHQDLCFEQAVEDFNSLSECIPLLQVLMSVNGTPREVIDCRELSITGLNISEVTIEPRNSVWDLSLSINEGAEGLGGTLEYQKDLFERETVERLLTGWDVLLGEMVTDIYQPVSVLPVMTEGERKRVVSEFNGTATSYPKHKTIQELFEEQVEQTPDAVAVEHGGRRLTYEQLNRCANRLARYLVTQGVGPDQVVGICLQRGLEMLVGLLAILKAAGAYLPLDPNYPTERLQQMVEDAAPPVVLTETELMGVLPASKARLIALDETFGQVAGFIHENLRAAELGLSSENLVYVIYTSGSTGRPKGTAMRHRSVVSLIEWHRRSFGEGKGRRTLQFAALSFDVAFQEIFSTLCTGGTLVLLDEWVRRDAKALAELLISASIERVFLPPLMLQSIAEYCESANQVPKSLKDVITAGEQLRVSAEIRELFKRLGGSRLHNHYGPTETHVVTALTLEGNPGEWPELPPIGRPISNSQIYVLDELMQPVPIGVVGEIYIGGANVARGYLMRPELTAQRFVPDPYSGEPGARLYKTGDMGRWRADGVLECLGRNDDQVKIRGFRVELGEIEAQLVRHGKVREAAVIVRPNLPGEKRLVAYVTPRDEGCPAVDELREYLRGVLPEYMVPSAFVTLEKLPLTPTGKLDRQALPAPDLSAQVSRAYEPPQGHMEEMLAGLWRELLRVERVGRNDNFFELGGHSLFIVQMMERLRRAGYSAEVSRVYESSTLAGVAQGLTRQMDARNEVPPNLIPPACQAVVPEMLPLVELEPEHIEQIVHAAPEGAINIKDIYPLAPLQEGMLFHHLLDQRGGDTYVISTLLSVCSRERMEELIAALQAVIDRHDILRTAILWEQLPRPVQVVYRRAKLPVEEVALDAGRDAEEQVREWLRPEQQHMDLRQAPLLRLRIAADPHRTQWYALLSTHHLVCDAESVGIILTEVVKRLQEPQDVPRPSVPYREHVAQVLAHAREHDAQAFFRGKLGDVEEPTAPFGLLDVYGDGSQVQEAREELESSLARRLRAQARRLSVSAATLFHAAWGLVVARTSGRDDVVFGTVLLGRLQGSAGAQRILGVFINTLPLRLKLRDVSAKDLVERTQREVVELLTHEQASLAEAQRCSGISGTAPLFTTLLNYRHSVPVPGSEWADASGIVALAGQERTNYPIAVSVDDYGEKFTLTAQTDRQIDPQRMLSYLHTAMRSLVQALEGAPQIPALELAVLPQSERQQVIELFNATRAEYPKDKLIQELFEEQVERTPTAIAVECAQRSLTYAELNSKANQLAWYLRARGVGPDQLVGICVERGIDMVVGLLGILKAGGAYVPLDPNYPVERLAYMVDDSAPNVMLTQDKLRHRLPRRAAQVVALDGDSSQIEQHSSDNLSLRPIGLTSKHLAYVIYTSGSTGEPKGVMINHRNVANLIGWHCSAFGLRPGHRCSAVAAMGFDASVWEIWPALSVGATLALTVQGMTEDVEMLLRWWVAQPLDVGFLPTPIAEFASSRNIVNAHLRWLLIGGDALRSRLTASNASIVNNYGPTECTVVATSGCLEAGEALHIGRPVSNASVFILNGQLQPVPIGVPGELYIAGDGVARGYLKRPELTAERFIPDPFSADPVARMYKTGDVGRWREGGTIEYLGRNDHQVKIRGYRIELGEIEAQLMRDPGVKEGMVISREDTPGEKRLVAYIVPQEPECGSPSVEELRQELRGRLPEYMVPSAFVLLERFPLTPNGKLDRRALPAPELSAFLNREYEAPQGEIEEILAGIWQSLLGVQRVGRNDNFFELGGHSLLIVQMMERLRRVGLSAEVRRIFESPTLGDLAAALGRGSGERYEIAPNRIPLGSSAISPEMLPLVDLQSEHIERIVQRVPEGATNIQDIYPLAPLQEGMLFHHLLGHKGLDTYVLPTLVSMASRDLLRVLAAALQTMIDRHDILRTAILWEQLPRPVQVVYRRAKLPVEEVALDTGRDAEEQVREWLRPEQQHMDLRQAPLLRLRIAADPHSNRWFALLQFHHITCDHVTAEDLTSEILAQLEGRTRALPPPAPYREHVAQVLAHAREHDAQAFFRGKLGDVEEPTAPFGLLDVYGDGCQVQEAREELESSLARRLRAQARRLSVSAATLFHAAWGLVVARTSGRDDVVFGTVLLGRLQGSAGAQRILGVFINTLPLRLKLRDVSAKDLVERTQREVVELLTHEQASLAEAQRCSGISGTAPLFTTLLNYRHSQRARQAEWPPESGITSLSGYERTNYPITFSIDDYGDGFLLTAQTDRRVDPRRILSYSETALRSLIQALEEAPQIPALELAVLPQSERQQVIELFNATRAEYPKDKLIQELFEEQVERGPDAVAVEHEEQRLTYRQLNRRANRLARHLISEGVGADKVVGVCMTRGLGMVVGLLAILKAGGAYLPLDPNYPAERLRQMLEDSDPSIILTATELAGVLPRTDATVIELNGEPEPFADLPEDNVPADQGCTPESLVYVIFTSGSTGRPKGAAMPHRSMVNLIEWHRTVFDAANGVRVLQFAALSFDVAFQEIFSTLCTGGTLVLLDESIRKDAIALARFLADRKIERLFLPPLMLQSLAQYAKRPENIPVALKDVITAGEQLRITSDIREYFARLPGCRLHNHYGPTETHVVTASTLIGSSAAWPDLPEIGRPIINAQIYVLNDRMDPVPIGVTGEIYIGGVSVARGYLKRPDLTNLRFVSSPYRSDAMSTLYKTGDLGRWSERGVLSYLGRQDGQVKIRGFRIELGEIEANLKGHRAVNEAVVLALGDSLGDKRLVAYIVSEERPTSEELRTHLKALLPEHMIPSAFVMLERMPLLPNGKLDRRSLADLPADLCVSAEIVSPCGETEEKLARIWQSVLKVSGISRNASFFELGGHSLHVMRLSAEIAEEYGVAISVSQVFRHQTVAELAALIECLLSLRPSPELVQGVECESGVV